MPHTDVFALSATQRPPVVAADVGVVLAGTPSLSKEVPSGDQCTQPSDLE